MPSADYYLRQGDEGAVIETILRDENGTAVDLNGASIRFHMAPIEGGAVTVNAEAVNEQDTTNGENGHVSYTWQAGDSDTPGLYLSEWEVTYVGGEVQTFPNTGYLLVRVTPQLSSAPEA